MISSDEAVDHAVAVLNRALASDPEAVRALLFQRLPCNEALADDPTIQVCGVGEDERHPETCAVGVLGLINGLFGTIPAGHPRAGWGPIAAVAESQGGPIVRFERTDR